MSTNLTQILAIPTAQLRALYADLQAKRGLAGGVNALTGTKLDLANSLDSLIGAGFITLADLGLGGAVNAVDPKLGAHVKTLNDDLNVLRHEHVNLGATVQNLRGDIHAHTMHINQLSTILGTATTDLTAMRDTLSDLAQAQADLATRSSGAVVDPLVVSAEVTRAVADAFKPLKQMVEDKGLQAEVGEAFAIHPTGEADPVDLFNQTDVEGLPAVQLWNDPTAPARDPLFVWQPAIIRHLLQSQLTGENLWLGGEKGTGKTQTVMQFAALTGRSFTRINFHKYTTAEEYFGAGALKNGDTCFEAGDFLKAYTRAGSVILLDEITNADAGELAPLNALLEPNAEVNIGGKVWKRAEGVLIFGADNTLGNGDASGRYAGTRQMNAALLDRFARAVHFNFLPRAVERQALMNHTGCALGLANAVLDVVDVCRAQLQTGALVDAPSLRQAIAFIRALPFHGVRDAWLTTIASKQPIEGAVELEAIYVSHVSTKSFNV
jgi:hypothetical protein